MKIKDMGKKRGAWGQYRAATHGGIALWRVIRNELLTLLFGYVPGALGLALRRAFFPCMFKACGRKVVFGYGLTFRHAGRITLGDGVILDDFAMLDAKGDGGGIAIGGHVFVGRGTKIYCKGGSIALGERVNISSQCTIYSGNSLTVGAGCMIGAYAYILSGGEYDWRDPTPYAEQGGNCTSGPLVIGPDCWIGARATVLDSARSIGERALIGACALVNRPVEARTAVGGVPARVIRKVGADARNG